MTRYRPAAVAGSLSWLGRVPGTITIVAGLWIVGALTGSLGSGPPETLRAVIAPGAEVADGRWWASLTAVWWCGSLAGYLASTALLLAVVAPAELRFGTWRTVALLLTSQSIGTLVGATLVSLGSDAGFWWYVAIEDGHALGPSIGVMGVGLALTFRLHPAWRRRVRALVLIGLGTMVLYVGSFEDILRLAGGAVGLLAGPLLRGRSWRPWLASPPPQVRTLVGFAMAAFAVGPLLALVSDDARGPLSVLQYLFSVPPVDPVAGEPICMDVDSVARCRGLPVVVRTGGGAMLASVVPVLLLMTAVAEGLRRGWRLAWWAAVALNLALVAVIGLDLVDAAISPVSAFAGAAGSDNRAEYMMSAAPLLIVPAALVIVLLLARRSFNVSAPRRNGMAGGHTGSAEARALLVEHGGSSLSYMIAWPGNRYWFASDGRCTVAYRVVATVALTTGDPIGPPEAHRKAIREFAEFCRGNGWTACLYSVTERVRDLVAADGWHSVQVGEDTVLPLAELAFTGRKWQDVRTALNKACKQGVVAEWCRYQDAPPAITGQIRAISAEWAASRRLPEMGFTLGGMAQLADREVRCLIAVDADRTVHGIVSWLPVYRAGRPVGWTLDFMRRRTGYFPGVMEFLIASSALRLRELGAEFVSLSCAPLARRDRGERPGAAQRLLDLTGRALEPLYGFGSLLAFKAKFQPVYRPLYMVYEDPAALLSISYAITRAYLPSLTLPQALRLLGRLLGSRRRAAARTGRS
jgi:lysylphosphatidylglycerol synthetase-like protein (DUF2156 family)